MGTKELQLADRPNMVKSLEGRLRASPAWTIKAQDRVVSYNTKETMVKLAP